jgi:hypothetical protein
LRQCPFLCRAATQDGGLVVDLQDDLHYRFSVHVGIYFSPRRWRRSWSRGVRGGLRQERWCFGTRALGPGKKKKGDSRRGRGTPHHQAGLPRSASFAALPPR